ncbi:MAG: FecR family protein [Bacteroidales bacterium]|nr:FecR family protein [Bacteroidales bacterium]
MKTIDNKTWELTSKYLSGEMTEDEKQDFNKWLNSNEDNKSFFNQAKSDWDKMENYKKYNNKNVDIAWDKLLNKFEENNLLHSEKKVKSISYFRPVLQYAAIIILLIGFSWGSYKTINYMNNRNINTIAVSGNIDSKQIILADGSKVFLNKGAIFKYPDKFDKDIRKVSLQGEAFFEIKPNPDKAFIVSVNNAEIKVLGTSFNVNTNNSDNKVEVFVETGKVSLYNKKNNIVIFPGHIGTLSKNKVSKKVNDNENYLSWKTKCMIFREEQLNSVVKTLNKVYHTEIIFADTNIEKLKLTSTFNKLPLESVVEVLCTTFDLTYEKNNDVIILKDKK